MPIACSTEGHAPVILSAIVAYGVAAVPLIAVVVYASWQLWHHARLVAHFRRIKTQSTSTAAVRAVRGHVVLDEGVPFALRVEVHQKGKTWTSKSATYHSWTETGRRVDARDFRLASEDGVLAQVQVNGDALLCIPFLRATGDNDDRAIVAQIGHGDEVTVIGRVFERGSAPLSSAYRGGALPQRVIRAPAGHRLVVSTTSLTEAFRRRMLLHARCLGVALAAILVTHGLDLLGYHVRWRSREVESAVVEGKRAVRGSKSTTYYLSVRTSSGLRIEQSATHACYVPARVGDQVEVLTVTGYPQWTLLGSSNTAHAFWLGMGTLLGLGMPLWNRGRLRTSGPWYLRKKVDMHCKGPPDLQALPES